MSIIRRSILSTLVCLIACSLLADLTKSNIAGSSLKNVGHIGQQYTTKDYIQDGLVAMWDGIENVGLGRHDGSVASMVDLAGENPTLTFKAIDGIWFYDNRWRNIDISAMKLSAEQYSFEYVAKKPVGKTVSVRYYPIATLAQKEGQYLSWKPSNGFARAYVGMRDSETLTSLLKAWEELETGYAASITYSQLEQTGKGYVNGIYIGRRISISLEGRTVSHLRFNCDESQCWVGSIRIYNRVLNEDEIAFNYAIDKERFNLL